MSVQNVFKRYEIKYVIKDWQRQLIESAMSEYMEPDRYGKSSICSIYFDTPDKLLIRRSMEKPVYKEKLRVRSYGVATEEQEVFVELKKKYKQVVYKRRIAMTAKEAEQYFEAGIAPCSETQIMREIEYFKSFYPDIEPSVFLSYDRSAYYAKDDPDFRMTFDENILWRDTDLSLTAGIYGTPLLDKGSVLLEVKTASALPLWLTHLLSENRIYKKSFSKYGKAYQSIFQMTSLGGTRSA